MGSHLEFANLLSLRGGDISIKVKGEHYFNYLVDNKEGLEELSSEFFKRKMNVEIKTAMDEGLPPAEKVDPIIKEAMRILGGKVIEDRFKS
ncbi:MAG: hypothetical protein HY878_01175 [Deltaproteobacteria bacterium]|nr:hypothetical protein [Deltaproteobacteria bacterium]